MDRAEGFYVYYYYVVVSTVRSVLTFMVTAIPDSQNAIASHRQCFEGSAILCHNLAEIAKLSLTVPPIGAIHLMPFSLMEKPSKALRGKLWFDLEMCHNLQSALCY